MRRACVTALVVLTALAWGADGASAHAVMSIDGATIVYNGNDDVSLNTLDVSLRGSDIRFFDRGSDGGIMPAGGCNPGETDSNGFIVEVLCPRAGRTAVRIDVGEGSDSVAVSAPLDAIVIGGRGADTITAGPGNDSLNGGDANDRISGVGGADILLGAGGDDTLAGGAGNDTVQASVGVDEVDGGDGDDSLSVRDGVADGVACGAGTDRVQADPSDIVRDGACESVEAGEATPGTAGAAPGPGPAAGGGGGSPSSTAGDRDPPRVRSGGSTLQRISRTNRLTVLATTSEAAEVVAAGTVTVGERRIVLKTARREVRVAGGARSCACGFRPRECAPSGPPSPPVGPFARSSPSSRRTAPETPRLRSCHPSASADEEHPI